jgi:hypothetical protein
MQAHATERSTAAPPDFSEWETVKGLSKLSKGKISETQIRWQLRFREENGLSEAVVKVGKIIYIHVPTYMRRVFSPQRGAA